MIHWFDKRPCQRVLESAEHPDPRLDDPCVLVMGDGAAPDLVRLPPELGGRELRVVDRGVAPCPKCGARPAHYLQLEDSYIVSECPSGCGFVWVQDNERWRAFVESKEEQDG